MSIIEDQQEPEFEGIWWAEPSNRPVMTRPPRMFATDKLIRQVRHELDLDDDTARRVADWVADWGERLGAWHCLPVFTLEGEGPQCSWCGAIWPLCGHHHMSGRLGEEETAATAHPEGA